MKLRVMIVEDEQIVAADLEARLGRLGYNVVGTAASGEEAVAMARSTLADIVLMDVQLQGKMNGTEAARQIHENTGAPIIFVTAFASVFVRNPEQMQAPGICLSKPFGMVQLKTALDLVRPDVVKM